MWESTGRQQFPPLVEDLYERHHDAVDFRFGVIGGEPDIGCDAAQDMRLHPYRPFGVIARAHIDCLARALRLKPHIVQRKVSQGPLVGKRLARVDYRSVEKGEALINRLGVGIRFKASTHDLVCVSPTLLLSHHGSPS